MQTEIEQYTNQNADKIRKNFLLFCSGSDRKILSECPDFEVIKHKNTGILLLFTCSFATLSGGYFFYTIFQDIRISIPFGIVWGLFFFFLDRAIISDIRKSDEMTKFLFFIKMKKEILVAFVRMSVALIIALVVSTSLELFIFRNKIDEQILSDINNSINTEIKDLGEKLDALNSKKDNYNRQIELARTVKPQTLLDAEKSEEAYFDSLANKSLEVTQMNLNYELSKIDLEGNNDPQSLKENKKLGKTTRANDAIKKNTEQKYKKAKSKLAEEEKRWSSNANERITALNKRNSINDKIIGITENGLKTYQDSNYVERIKIERFEKNKDFLPYRYGGMKKVQGNDEYMNRMGWVLWILFLGIELTPIIRKLLLQKGIYEDKMDTEERIFRANEMLKLTIHEDIRNNILKTVQKEQLEVELNYKKEVTLLRNVYSNFDKDLTELQQEFRENNKKRILENQKTDDVDEKEFIKESLT